MDDLTRALWQYGSKYQLESCYDQSMQEEREDNENMMQRNQEKLKVLCSAELKERVENIFDALEILRTVDMEAAFTCGLRLGLSLR